MDIEPNAQRRIDEHIRASLQNTQGTDAAETERELRSHVYEAAQRFAQAAHATRIETPHVDAALAEMGSPSHVARDLGPTTNPWRPRVPLTRRGIAALGLALAAAFIGCAYIAVGALCRFSRPGGIEAYETCAPGVSAWGGFFVAAVLAGTVGVWLALRWIPLVAAAFLLVVPFMSVGGDWFFGLLCALLFVASAIVLPTGRPRARTQKGPLWHYVVFLPAGLIGAIFVNLVLEGLFGLQLEGFPAFLGALFLSIVVIWALLLVVLRRRDAGFAAGTMALVVFTTFIGFMVFFVASFAGSGCFPQGPAGATWSDETLFGRMPTPGRHSNFTVTNDPASAGLPFTNLTLDQRYGRENYSLTSVAWTTGVDSPWGATEIALETGPRLSFGWSGDTPDARVKEVATRFLANVTSASQERIAQITDELVAQRVSQGDVYTADPAAGARPVPMYRSSIAFDAPLRLVELWESHDGQRRDPVSGAQLPPDWTYGFSYASAKAAGLVRGRDVSFTVTAQGSASIDVGGPGVATPAESRRALEVLYQDLGLGAPPTVQPQSTQTICVD